MGWEILDNVKADSNNRFSALAKKRHMPHTGSHSKADNMAITERRYA